MANAFFLKPMPIAGVQTFGSIFRGVGSYTANDYAGVVCQLLCDSSNQAAYRVDLGSDQTIDTAMLFGVSDFPSAGIVDVATATAGAPSSFTTRAFISPYAGTASRVDGQGVALASLASPVTARYVQFTFAAPISGQSVTVSRIVIGRRFQPAIGFEYGATFGVRDLGSLDVSTRGVLLRHRGKKLRTLALNFPRLTKADSSFLSRSLLEQVGNTECVAICTDPSADPELQDRCYFGPLVGDIGRTWASAGGFEVRVNLLGLM